MSFDSAIPRYLVCLYTNLRENAFDFVCCFVDDLKFYYTDFCRVQGLYILLTFITQFLTPGLTAKILINNTITIDEMSKKF